MFIPCPRCKNPINLDQDRFTSGGREILICRQCGARLGPDIEGSSAGGLSVATGPSPGRRLRVSPEEFPGRPTQHVPPPARGRVRTRNPLATLVWALAILVLIMAFVAQFAYFMREELARHPPLRPWVEQLCVYADCEVPLMRTPSQIRILGRDVRRHPEFDDALMVNLTISNHAPYTQAFPIIQLRFFNMRDEALAQRRFTPDEYLPKNIEMEDGMPSNTPVRAVLEIVDPGPSAVNFAFEIL